MLFITAYFLITISRCLANLKLYRWSLYPTLFIAEVCMKSTNKDLKVLGECSVEWTLTFKDFYIKTVSPYCSLTRALCYTVFSLDYEVLLLSWGQQPSVAYLSAKDCKETCVKDSLSLRYDYLQTWSIAKPVQVQWKLALLMKPTW